MTCHAKDSLRGAGIAQVLDLLLAVAAAEAVGAKGLVAREDGQVFDLVAAVVAAIRAVVAYQRTVTQQQQVCVRVEQGAARVAAEAVNVPSVAGCAVLARVHFHSRGGIWRCGVVGRQARGHVSERRKVHTELEGLAFLEDLDFISTCTAL